MRVLRARLYEQKRGRAAGRGGGRPARPGGHRRAGREDPHLQLPAGPRDRPPRQAHGAQPRRGARRASSTSSPTRCGTPSAVSGSPAPRRPQRHARPGGARQRGDPAARGARGHAAAGRRGPARGRHGRRPRRAVPRPRRRAARRRRSGRSRPWSLRRRKREPVAYIVGQQGLPPASNSRSTRACSCRGPRPSCWSRWRSACRRARACSTSGPAAAPSRWRSRTSAPTSTSPAATCRGARSRWRGPTPSGWAWTSPSRSRTCSTASAAPWTPSSPIRPTWPTPSARCWRPRSPATSRRWALFAGPDGLELIRDLVPAAAARAPWLALEVGAGQADAVGGAHARRGLRARRAPSRPGRHRARRSSPRR